MGHAANQTVVIVRLAALLTVSLTPLSCKSSLVATKTHDQRAATLASALATTNKSSVTATVDQASGKVTGAMSASALVTQEISGDGSAALSGILVAFAPGTLAVDTTISMQESVAIATNSNAAALGVSGAVTGVGTPVTVQPSVTVDPLQPFTVSLSLPADSSLTLADSLDKLVVMYKINIYAENKVKMGVLPRTALTVDGSKVSFSIKNFGAFQLAYTESVVATATEVESSTPIQTKAEVASLPALSLTGRSPYVVRAGDTVTISGQNFRSTMTLALGGKSVNQLSVASDVKASFVVPRGLDDGSVTLVADQDGVTQTAVMLATTAPNGAPIITLSPSDVCSGTVYYNGEGVRQVGTKKCVSDDCTGDNQTGCIASANYPAAKKPEAWTLRYGTTVAGVGGALKTNCRNGAALSKFDASFDNGTGTVSLVANNTTDFVDALDDGPRQSPGEAVLAGSPIAGWAAGTLCDASVWDDVTTSSVNQASTCAVDSFRCQYKDRISGLIVSTQAMESSANGVVASQKSWADAIKYCHLSTYGGQASGSWRLPTQKELLALYVHGIVAVASNDFIAAYDLAEHKFWAATTVASDTNKGWSVNLSTGEQLANYKSTGYGYVICVR